MMTARRRPRACRNRWITVCYYNTTIPLGYVCGELPDDLDTIEQNNKRVEERFGEAVGQFQITRRYTAELDYVTDTGWEFEARAGTNQQVFDEIHDASWDDSFGVLQWPRRISTGWFSGPSVLWKRTRLIRASRTGACKSR